MAVKSNVRLTQTRSQRIRYGVLRSCSPLLYKRRGGMLDRRACFADADLGQITERNDLIAPFALQKEALCGMHGC